MRSRHVFEFSEKSQPSVERDTTIKKHYEGEKLHKVTDSQYADPP